MNFTSCYASGEGSAINAGRDMNSELVAGAKFTAIYFTCLGNSGRTIIDHANTESQLIQYCNFYQNDATLGVCFGSDGYGLTIQNCFFIGTVGIDAGIASVVK
jgi:hypothetical protein